ncbi:MAG: hypothetical protein JJE47_06890 [Acidimicrobiia bacterium]|nr:hypothetical protein [Acidimicrobiia bacterium]
MQRLAVTTVKAVNTIKASEPAAALRRSMAPTMAATEHLSAPGAAMRPHRPAKPSSPVRRLPQAGHIPPGPMNLPFVEMFGFDGDNEVLSDEEFLPVMTAHAPSQAILLAEPELAEPALKSIRPTRLGLFDSIPRLSEIGAMTAGENTGNLIERLWQATDGLDALEGSWTSVPSSLSARFQNTDRRWGQIAAIAAAIALIVFVAFNLRTETATSPEIGPARTAIQAAAGTVDDLTLISGYLAEPNTPAESLSGSAVLLATIDRAARDLSTAASGLSSWDGYGDVASVLSSAADRGSLIESRLGDALSYRLVSDTLFRLPALPAEADRTLSGQIGFDLATMVSDAERALERLPRDPSLTSHRLETEQLAADLLPMIDRYLEALRSNDADVAAATGNNMIERVVANHTARDTAYDQFDTEIAELALAYEADLQAAGDLLNRAP